ncbi:photosystem II cytochrome c-550 [Spirulina sp. CS-785/01]|uniref:photosystem II cytochrome c-550 n=1 Tax=Spirulina sp. CS-785/01 TaxID=3021716 RepID=UPI00232C2E94|nr:photosystem II cytochrome c-550 [Spirulina sp. CS-785/01]MDB9313093.1 photosystem II cytochrome c-550 [Spirulina sp. CS-785/01]
MRPLRLIWVAIATVLLGFQISTSTAFAVDVNAEYRTITLNEAGEEVTISNQELEKGKRLFNNTCSQCHMAGRTKTNPNVTLKLSDLKGAEPPRDNIKALADYMQNPTTYDGEIEISELHPSTSRSDLWPEMRPYSQEDLEAIAGYILVQPKLQGIMWGGGKTVN